MMGSAVKFMRMLSEAKTEEEVTRKWTKRRVLQFASGVRKTVSKWAEVGDIWAIQ
ncbi:MAG: hypothetical protein WC444_05065 [Candidatus Paceibacterota bacterium]